MTNEEIRRQLGNMPTGPNDMSQYAFRVERKIPDWERLVTELSCWPQQTQEQQSVIKQAGCAE
jgi:hypothetical protein